MICSLCCGESRSAEMCTGCSYYQKPKRKYNKIPRFTTIQMADDPQLEEYGKVIEGALCAYDIKEESKLGDKDAGPFHDVL